MWQTIVQKEIKPGLAACHAVLRCAALRCAAVALPHRGSKVILS